jgi:hypothetical protein
VGCDDDDDPTGPDIVTLQATLTGPAEVPDPGDPDGTGTAEIELNDDDNEVCWDITVANILLPASAAHIHAAAAGVPGGVVVTLSAPTAAGTASDCVDVADDLVDDIIASPSSFYVNVHNADFPGGAVRGQLSN